MAQHAPHAHRMTRRRWLGTLPLGAPALAACGAGATGMTPRPEAGPATVQFYFSGGVPEQQLYASLKEVYERQYPKYKLELVQGGAG